MNRIIKTKTKKLLTAIKSILLFVTMLCYLGINAYAQPANDNCNNATVINIPNSGYGTGIYTSSIIDITSATMQAGETVSATNLIASQNQKTVWYKFTLGTTRQLRVSLKQNGTSIPSGAVGFAMYETGNCLPNNGQLSGLISPLESFGNSFNPCVKSGEYLIQICARTAASGNIFIELEIDHVNTLPQFNTQASAYDFGTIDVPSKVVLFNVSCQSKEPNEVCSSLNMNEYTKTSWHTFTTKNGYFDYVNIMLASNSGTFGSNQVFGFNLYQGDAKTTPLNSLVLVDGCDTIQSDGNYAGVKKYLCGELQSNTTYSIQLFYHKNFNHANFKLSISSAGEAPTGAPRPIYNQMNTANILGALANGNTQRQEYMACNAIFTNNGCGNLLPNSGITYNGAFYDMATFYSLTLSLNAQLNIAATAQSPTCGNILVRVFKDSISNNCASIPLSSLVDEFIGSKNLYCLEAGKYTIQILTRSELYIPLTHHYVTGSNTPTCYNGYLGRQITLNLNTTYFPQTSHFNLSAPGKFDTINNYVPLAFNTVYPSTLDTVSCNNTVVPANSNCAANFTKVLYRQFNIADSGSVSFSNLNATTMFGVSLRYGLFKGNANSLAIAQNAWNYPQTISGLEPYSFCFAPQVDIDICVTPGTYTFATYGRDYHGGFTDRPYVVVRNYTTQHKTPATALNLGSIIDTINNPLGGQITTLNDTFSCVDNAVTIDTIAPCENATKAIYREFYLNQPAKVTITKGGTASGQLAFFKGRVSVVGTNGLVGLWSCFTSKKTDTCEMLPVGWYTVVSYGKGSGYNTPFFTNDITGGDVGKSSNINIKVEFDCLAPRFNRPYKASVDSLTNNPYLIQWNAAADTGAFPVTEVKYILRQEHFNCDTDTPFVSPTFDGCGDSMVNRVTYYVFELTQESYLSFNTKGHWAKIYKRDIRVDSMLFSTLTPLQECMKNSQRIEICKAQPGIYTLVIFGTDNDRCTNLTPEIFVDKVGTSRFDHANNSYDFAVVPPDNIYYNGRVGDANPFHVGRAASNDFFYCTTGSRIADPIDAACNAAYNPNVYNVPDTNNVLYPQHTTATTITRRNLWYTFVIDRPGNVSVKVVGKTINKNNQARFAIYSSDVNPLLTFNQVVSNGLVDSTITQGLEFVAANDTNAAACTGDSVVTFLLSPCNGVYPRRYYVLVDNVGNSGNYNIMRPNHQVEVAVKLDTVVNNTLAKYDYFANAYNLGTLTQGTYLGDEDNYTCASTTINESSFLPSCAQKTLWYKFNIGTFTSGELRVRLWLDSFVYNTTANDIRLYKVITPGDSTASGLQAMSMNYFSGWQRLCIKEGTYYLAITGCNRSYEFIYPEILLDESDGDFCSNAVNLSVVGPGNYSVSLNVDCHTIGTDYGELGDTLTCPPDSLTQNYKSSWFKVDVGGVDSLDVTAFITENTNVNANKIMYRMMSGNCNAMQEQSCVLDANTQNTYFCLLPGRSYYIQVFTPVTANNNSNTTGSITLNVNAVPYQDSCAPPSLCFSNAAFTYSFNCTLNDSTIFNNHSTFGSSIVYHWDFGYNNDTSNLFAPKYRYPALPYAANYTITLRVINTDCDDTSYISNIITIPPRPEVDLGPDTAICNANDSLLLDATFATGATYIWHDNSTNPTYVANLSGFNTYSVTVTYAGCTASDTISVFISDLVKNPIDTIYKCNPNESVWLNAYQPVFGVSYTWNTNSNDSAIQTSDSGLYWVELSDGACIVRDSFVVINIFDSLINLGPDTNICIDQVPYVLDATYNGATYQWQNNSINATFNVDTTGLYWVIVTKDGCSMFDSVSITVNDLIIANLADTFCFGTYYVLPWNDTAYTSGTYSDTFATLTCDSIVNVHLAVRDSVPTVSVFDTICNNQLPYVWNGQNVTTATAQFTTANIYGCDSTTNLFLTINTTDSIVIYDTICADELPYNFLGTPINASGTYYDTLNTIFGCDSFVRLHLQVNPIYNDTLNENICSGDSFVLNNIAHYTSGTYTYNLSTTLGCDSNVVLNLNVTPYIVSNTYDTFCFGTYYLLPWNDTVYSAGIYSDTFGTTSCDSISNIHLAVRDSVPTVSVFDTICNNQLPYVWNGQNVTTATAQFTTANIYGCDSTTNLFLTINTTDSIVIYDTICADELPYNFLGTPINASGTYYDTLNTVYGCDSFVRLHLQVNPIYNDTLNENICSGDSFVLNNIAHYNSGTYTYNLSTTLGCDSNVVLNLNVTPYIVSNTYDTICFGTYYVLPWNDTVYSAGIYSDTFGTTSCDSISNIHLAVRDSVPTVSVFDTICNNQLPYVWNGQNVTTATAQFTTANIYGCDSTTNLFLTINTTDSIVIYDTICADELPYNFLGTFVNGSGTYYDTLNTIFGCDSFVRLHLQVNPIYNDTLNENICSGDSFVLNNIAHYTSGTYTYNLSTTLGCDSNVVLNLNVTPYITSNAFDSVCFGEHYILPWNDTVYTSGTYSDTFTTTSCDSISFIHLYVRDSVPPVTVYDSTCINELPYLWNGINVNTTTAQFTTSNIHGCDSTTILNLTIHPTDSITVYDTICSNQLPYNFFGNNLNGTGTYNHTAQTILGCDSYITLHLQVFPYFTDTTIATICQGDSFVLNNIAYYTTGLYTQTYSSVNACDSYAVLNLTVIPTPQPPTVNSPVVYCQGEIAVALTALGSNLLWYTSSVGGTGSAIAPVPSTAIIGQTWYYVSQTVNNCESERDSILVIVNERPIASFDMLPDSAICEREDVIVTFSGLLPTGANMIWNWSGGQVTGNDPGPYSVNWNGAGNKIISLSINNGGCMSNTFTDNIIVLPVAATPKIIVPDFVCINDTVLVVGDINIPNSNYIWTYNNTNLPDQKEHQFVWTQPRTHRFTLQAKTDGCLSPTASKDVTVVPIPEIAFAINNTQDRLCLDAPINIFNNKHIEGYQYQWGPEQFFQYDGNRTSSSVNAMLSEKGWINVVVEDQYGCVNSDSIYLDVVPCCEYFIPNAFSPNGDGVNDEFLPYTYSLYQLYDFQVFNRWGERVFVSSNQNQGWDGTYKGKQADVGVYHYYFRFICGLNGSLEVKKGEIHLVR